MTFASKLPIFAILLIGASCASAKKVAETTVCTVTNPARQDLEITRRYVSQVRAIQHIEMRALERGYLEKTFVDEGQLVKQGQKMFQILPALSQAELQKAQAEGDFVQIEFENTKILADRKIVSPNELALSRAKLEKAKAEVSLARVHRDFTEVKAPFDGIMGRLSVRLGSLVAEGELLTTLSDNSKMWIYFNVPEVEYLDYRSRMDGSGGATVRLEMANGKLFEHPGKVETIEADFNNETGTIAFRATVPNPEGLLRHGETGTILMPRLVKGALVIAQKSTFEVLDKRFVYVVDEASHTVRARLITVSEELPHRFIVESGITEKDQLVLEGLSLVRDGDVVGTRFVPATDALAHLDAPAE